MRALSSSGRALPWHGRGDRFESGRVHQRSIIANRMEYTGNDRYCDVILKDTSLLKKEYESDNVLAYHHTNPFCPVHIVVIPKKHIPSFTNRESIDDPIVAEMFEVVRKIAKKVEDEQGAARILTNLGKYQDSKHFHIHISSGEPLR